VRAAAWTAAALLALAPFAAAVLDRDAPSRNPEFGATAERLGSVGSNRFGYWEVALETFADDPAIGAGAGAFATEWIARRESAEVVRDAHSLWLETAAELGLVGLAFLLLSFAGVTAAAVRFARTDPGLAAGPVAALAVWAAHSAIDWDWELPALTLVAALLAGVILARSAADG
jgi:O-antigen ligase